MTFIIRHAKSDDVPSILTLIQELAVYEKAALEVDITNEILHDDLFGTRKIIDCQVAEIENEIAGIAIYYTKYSTWKGRCLYLEDIVVSERFRGSGIGKALFKEVINVAKENNSGRMEWQVLDWNTSAIDFYKAFGAVLDSEWINGKFTKKQLQEFKFQ
ncbi:MAG: GNAT family N-acetyltransferase [Bacteroidia bacterium]